MTPWPLPWSMDLGETRLAIAANVSFECADGDGCDGSACASDIAQGAFARAAAAIAPASPPPAGAPALAAVGVCIATASLELGPATNESYALEVDADGAARVRAASVFGALHALETLAQLVDDDDEAGGAISNAPVAIDDRPRFGYRGLLIDTGRHFLPVAFIKRVIDGLHASKLNLLHWHLVDSQSFPCGSETFPELAAAGAFAPAAAYAPDDLREIVAYARARGVRVMPEWDVPGHGSWGFGKPEVMGCDDVLDPTQDATYDFLNAFFGEMMTIFPDEYVFLGGDEVDHTCWDANPAIAAWLAARNMTSAELEQYFWRQVTARVLPASLAGRTVSIWEADALQVDPAALPAGTVANVYQSLATADATIANYSMPTVVSIADSNWYLDLQCDGYNWNSWQCRYAVEPTTDVTARPALRPLLLGGEAAMWGEGINKRNFDAYVWHGAAAIAERLWSDPAQTTDLDAARDRLAEHMCRYAARGFNPGPVYPGYCAADL